MKKEFFLYASKLRSFSLLVFGLVIFGHQNIGKKFAHKMLMKLATESSDEF